MTDSRNDLRQALEAELDRLRETDVGRRMEAIELLLMDGNLPDLPTLHARSTADAGRRGPGVSQAKMDAVREYMQSHGEARQVDIASDLQENTGSVSLALRALAAEGSVEDTGRVENKAKVWSYTGPSEGPATRRATVVEPGNGVREGRLAR
jgi:hypothetical protein